MSIICAYLLDMVFGDPQWFPHPVRVIGFCVQRLEVILRSFIRNEKFAGVLLVILIVVPTYNVTFLLLKIAFKSNLYFGIALNSVFIYTAIAMKDLKVHVYKIYDALKNNDIIRARNALALVVGRDTENLAERDIIRASVETVAENIVDGVISPLFYAFIGGAPLALSYKAVNTLDSMVGYKNERYKRFGWASARLDDVANFIPARLSLLFLSLASWLCGHNGVSAFRIGVRDGRKNPSPNSGIPEAAIAGALGVQLGGLNFYKSAMTEKPLIGDNLNPLGVSHIKESVTICYAASGLFVVAGVLWLYFYNAWHLIVGSARHMQLVFLLDYVRH